MGAAKLGKPVELALGRLCQKWVGVVFASGPAVLKTTIMLWGIMEHVSETRSLAPGDSQPHFCHEHCVVPYEMKLIESEDVSTVTSSASLSASASHSSPI